MAAAVPRAGADPSRTSDRDGNTFIPALLPGIGPSGSQGFSDQQAQHSGNLQALAMSIWHLYLKRDRIA
jgi:hypothetical protein